MRVFAGVLCVGLSISSPVFAESIYDWNYWKHFAVQQGCSGIVTAAIGELRGVMLIVKWAASEIGCTYVADQYILITSPKQPDERLLGELATSGKLFENKPSDIFNTFDYPGAGLAKQNQTFGNGLGYSSDRLQALLSGDKPLFLVRPLQENGAINTQITLKLPSEGSKPGSDFERSNIFKNSLLLPDRSAAYSGISGLKPDAGSIQQSSGSNLAAAPVTPRTASSPWLDPSPKDEAKLDDSWITLKPDVNDPPPAGIFRGTTIFQAPADNTKPSLDAAKPTTSFFQSGSQTEAKLPHFRSCKTIFDCNFGEYCLHLSDEIGFCRARL